MEALIVLLSVVIFALLVFIFIKDNDYETGKIYYKSEEIIKTDQYNNPLQNSKSYYFHK